MRKGQWILAMLLTACTSVGTLGLVTRSSGDPGAVLRTPTAYRELGPASGRSCRYFLFGVAPWGDGTFSSAVEQALQKVHGDALVNVTVTNSLYSFIPIYNVFGHTCTEVRGIAIAFEGRAAGSEPAREQPPPPR